MAVIVKSKVKSTILKIMEDTFGVPSHSTKNSDSFAGDLFVEGVDFEELIVICNKHYGIRIKDADKLTTVGKLVNYIKDI